MTSTEKLTIRLSHEEISILQYLIDKGVYESLQDIVHEAIIALIKSKITSKDLDKISKLSPEHEVNIEKLLSDFETTEMDKKIRTAVLNYVKTKMDLDD